MMHNINALGCAQRETKMIWPTICFMTSGDEILCRLEHKVGSSPEGQEKSICIQIAGVLC